jgi:hypothetical protein
MKQFSYNNQTLFGQFYLKIIANVLASNIALRSSLHNSSVERNLNMNMTSMFITKFYSYKYLNGSWYLFKTKYNDKLYNKIIKVFINKRKNKTFRF